MHVIKTLLILEYLTKYWYGIVQDMHVIKTLVNYRCGQIWYGIVQDMHIVKVFRKIKLQYKSHLLPLDIKKPTQ